MKRLACHIATVCSLLLCIASLALWIRSHFRIDTWEAFKFSGSYEVKNGELIAGPQGATIRWGYLQSAYDNLAFEWAIRECNPGPQGFMRESITHSSQASRGSSLPLLRRLTYFHGGANTTGPNQWTRRHRSGMILIPHWLLVLPAAIVPAMRFLRWRQRRKRRGSGFCLHCGYDLRASTGKCPECGAEISNSTSSAQQNFIGGL